MDHTAVGLAAAIRALRDVVAPAVDPAEAQAHDQLRLTIDYLRFLQQRVDRLHDRERFELRHHLDLARTLRQLVDPCCSPAAGALEHAIAAGTRALGLPGASMQALRDATAALAAAASGVVRDAGRLDAASAREMERCVLHHSRKRIEFERSWYLPLGLDPDPQHVQPLEAAGLGLG
jgi:hypothetical protein